MKYIDDIVKRVIDSTEDRITDAYKAGYTAGYLAKAQEEKDQRTHMLHDLYRRGYIQGEADTRAEIGEITLDDLKEVLEA